MNGSKSPPEKLHALCKLTWITKGNGKVADSTRSVVAPALEVLLGVKLRGAKSPETLRNKLRDVRARPEIVDAADGELGFVNFYTAFRNTSLTWVTDHRVEVWKAFSTAATARTDDDARRAYEIVDELPPLPRRRNAAMPAFNLLTPVLACLDPRGRSPIINSRKDVQERLRRLEVHDGTLVDRFDELVDLLDRTSFTDAFALDVAGPRKLHEALSPPPKHIVKGNAVEMLMDEAKEWEPGVIEIIDNVAGKVGVRFPDRTVGWGAYRYTRPGKNPRPA